MQKPPSTLPAAPPDRARIQLDLAPAVASMLEHAANVLGVPKTQLIVQALLQALPGMVDQAELFKRRSRELASGSGAAKR